MAKIIVGKNDLATTHPELVESWDYQKNTKTPQEVSYGSGAIVWWKCPAGHSYQQAIYKKVSRNHGCPVCSGHRTVSGVNDFATTFPEIAKEWHPTKNGDLLPSEISKKNGKKVAVAIDCKVGDTEKGILLSENDLVFVTNGSCTEGTIYGDQDHAPNGDAEVRTSGCWSLWKNIAKQDPSFGHPEKFCSDVTKTNWESATITTLDDKIIPYITNICKRDPRSGKVVTGGIVSCQDSSWLLSWTINRQGQFKTQDKDKVCEAANEYLDFLKENEQHLRILQYGYRPARIH